MSWEVVEQPHELRYRCPHEECVWTVTAPALDPIADEVIRVHEQSHGVGAVWASRHVAQQHMWDLAPRRVRDWWGDAAAASAVLAGGLMLVALLSGWF